MTMLDCLEDINNVINDYNIEYNEKTGGFFVEDHTWKLQFRYLFSDVSKLTDSDDSELHLVSPDLFLDILKKTESSFYKIFSEC